MQYNLTAKQLRVKNCTQYRSTRQDVLISVTSMEVWLFTEFLDTGGKKTTNKKTQPEERLLKVCYHLLRDDNNFAQEINLVTWSPYIPNPTLVQATKHINTLQLPGTKKYTFPQKHLKIRFGATGSPFSSTSFPFANLLGFPLAFAQTAQGTRQLRLVHSVAGPHSVRSSVPLLPGLGLHFLPRRKTRKGMHLPCSSHKLNLKHAQSWAEGLGTALLGAVFFPQLTISGAQENSPTHATG